MYLDKPGNTCSIHGDAGGGGGGGDCGRDGGGDCGGGGGGGEVWGVVVVVVVCFLTEFLSRDECNDSRKSLLSLVFTPVAKRGMSWPVVSACYFTGEQTLRQL